MSENRLLLAGLPPTGRETIDHSSPIAGSGGGGYVDATEGLVEPVAEGTETAGTAFPASLEATPDEDEVDAARWGDPLEPVLAGTADPARGSAGRVTEAHASDDPMTSDIATKPRISESLSRRAADPLRRFVATGSERGQGHVAHAEP